MIGTGILVAAAAVVAWYYDNDIRDYVKSKWGKEIKKGEDAVVDLAKQAKDAILPEDDKDPKD